MATPAEENLPKTLSHSLNTNFSSFIRKYTQKPPSNNSQSTSNLSKTYSRLRAENISPQSISNLYSPNASANVFISPRYKNPSSQTDGSYLGQPVYLRPQKKVLNSSLRTGSREVPSQDQSDVFNGTLDHHTFYSSEFSLFDAKQSPRKPSAEPIARSTQTQLLPVPLQTVKEEKPLKTIEESNRIQPQDLAKPKGFIGSKSPQNDPAATSRLSHFAGKEKATTSSRLNHSQSAKRKSSSPAAASLKAINNYLGNKIMKQEKRSSSHNDSPSKPNITIQIPSPLPNPNKTVFNSPKGTPKTAADSKTSKILRSISPGTSSRLELKTPNRSKKITLPEETQSSADYMNKIFKGLDNKGLLKFAPEHYKRLGKSPTNADFTKAANRNPFFSQKGVGPLETDINPWNEKIENKGSNEEVGSIDSIEDVGTAVAKEVNDDDIAIGNVSSTCSLGHADGETRSSEEQRPQEKIDKDQEQQNEEKNDTEGTKRDEDKGKMLNSGVIRKDKETFEEFCNGAMIYMSELIATYEGKNPNTAEEKEYEDHLALLLSHMLNEISMVRKGLQNTAERIKIGKKLLLLLEMALRSATCLIKRKNMGTGLANNKSNLDKLFPKRGKNTEEKMRFEDIFGLQKNQGLCDLKERQAREKLCQDVERRREELEVLEKSLKEKKDKRMLEYVQSIRSEVTKVLKSNKMTDKR